uniref:Uncharacterized protein n=1 Tax=Anguilla anguilla TaxID=7936 RepID=A0A0E9QWY9_ANGAN
MPPGGTEFWIEGMGQCPSVPHGNHIGERALFSPGIWAICFIKFVFYSKRQ